MSNYQFKKKVVGVFCEWRIALPFPSGFSGSGIPRFTYLTIINCFRQIDLHYQAGECDKKGSF